jgi:hypothetical protein
MTDWTELIRRLNARAASGIDDEIAPAEGAELRTAVLEGRTRRGLDECDFARALIRRSFPFGKIEVMIIAEKRGATGSFRGIPNGLVTVAATSGDPVHSVAKRIWNGRFRKIAPPRKLAIIAAACACPLAIAWALATPSDISEAAILAAAELASLSVIWTMLLRPAATLSDVGPLVRLDPTAHEKIAAALADAENDRNRR